MLTDNLIHSTTNPFCEHFTALWLAMSKCFCSFCLGSTSKWDPEGQNGKETEFNLY